MCSDKKKYFLIGIGGAGMSALARLLHERGMKVYGSDIKSSPTVNSLIDLGIEVFIGHKTANIAALPLVDFVVVSKTAIPKDNPEYVFAEKNNIPIKTRVDILTDLMSGFKQLLIAGSHGKTSTTSMLIEGLEASGIDPSFAVGGQLNQAETNAHIGQDDIFVAEVDESDGSILQYAPNVIGITNIEPDHLNFYHTAAAYFEVFKKFITLLPKQGILVINIADKGIQRVVKTMLTELSANKIQIKAICNIDVLADVPAEILDIVTDLIIYNYSEEEVNKAELVYLQKDKFDYAISKTDFQKIKTDYLNLKIFGYHMLTNALLSVQMQLSIGVGYKTALNSVEKFSGVARRSELKGEVNGIIVFDDYAHHPSEINALLTSMRKIADKRKGKLLVWFQPHLYSRTHDFEQEFADSLSLADTTFISDIYGAREKPIPGVSSYNISDLMGSKGETILEADKVVDKLARIAVPQDTIVLVGAGDITFYATKLLQQLEETASHA